MNISSFNNKVSFLVINYPENSDLWSRVSEYFKLRKRIFVDQLDWELYSAEGLEFEQYDNFANTTYIVAIQNNKVVAGARLRRTDSSYGSGLIKYSYMIRDACIGLLPGLPRNLCYNVPPQDEKIWELTRMVVVGPKEMTVRMLDVVNNFLVEQGATSCLFLGSPAFVRMARNLDWPITTLGPICSNGSGRFQVFSCPTR